MKQDLYSVEEIAAKVKQLGKQITKDYQGQEVVFVGVLKGSFIFMADLVRAVDLSVSCEFMQISSYGDGQVSGKMELLLDLPRDKVEGKHLLIIEDIVDTGNSMHFVLAHLAQYNPASLKICTFLFKEAMFRRQNTVSLDYVGFTIEPNFVVGYGMDVAGKLRNYPAIGIYQ